jgi:hypothetical protein
MLLRALRSILFIFALIFVATSGVRAQSSSIPPPPDEQNETFLDTFKRMQIKREEEEHKKLVEKATQLKDAAESLSKDSDGKRLARAADKKLREIEKSAKQIRSDAGGSDGDFELETPPATLPDALKQLNAASQRLLEKMAKTSRHVVSVTVVTEATEIIHLVKIVRGYLN